MGFFDKLVQAADKATKATNDAIDKAGKSDAWAKITDVAGQFANAAEETAKDVKKTDAWAKLSGVAGEFGDAVGATAQEVKKTGFWDRVTDVANQFADAAKETGASIKRAAEETSAESQYWGRPKGGRKTYWAEDIVLPDGLPKDHGRDDYFADLIRANFPELAMRTWVPITEFNPASDVMASANIVLFRGPEAVLTILLVPKDKYKNWATTRLMEASQRSGIPVMRFMREFENRPEYVIGRLRSVL